jgi:hypothetical protein
MTIRRSDRREPRLELAIVGCALLVGTCGWLISRAETAETATVYAALAQPPPPKTPAAPAAAATTQAQPEVPLPRPRPG